MKLSKPHITKKEIEKIIQKVIGFEKTFAINDTKLYQLSLVHRSISVIVQKIKSGNWKSEDETFCDYLQQEQSNERLELLGDSIIGAVSIEYLFNKYPNKQEGDLTKYRTRIVCGSTLAKLAIKIGLKGKILMSDQVLNAGGLENKRILEDAFEAFIGALYLDLGFEITKMFIISLIEKEISKEDIETENNFKDILLQYTRDHKLKSPEYKICESGKSNDRTFRCTVFLFKSAKGKGVSSKKKEAEQKAARNAIENLRIRPLRGPGL